MGPFLILHLTEREREKKQSFGEQFRLPRRTSSIPVSGRVFIFPFRGRAWLREPMMREPEFETVFLLAAVTVVRERGPFLLQQAVNPFELLLPLFRTGPQDGKERQKR